MKVLYASDLHGEIPLYQDLFNFARAFLADVVAIGGDLLPSFPPNRRYEDMIPHQMSFIDQFLGPFFERLLSATSVRRIITIPGNWDLGYGSLFGRAVGGVIDLSEKYVQLENGYEMIGYPFVPPTPFRPKDYEKMDDPETPWPPQKIPSYIRSTNQGDRLMPIDAGSYLRGRGSIREDLPCLPRPANSRKTIYIMHSPPFGTKLDLMHGGGYAGSRSILKFIEETQPFLTLHGHIHESPECSGSFFDRIGKTLCINPGQSIGASRLRLHAVTFEMENAEETIKHTLFSPATLRNPAPLKVV